MPLPCPGPAQISLVDIQNEFGGSNPIGLNEYYRNGGLVPSNNTSVPTSGAISLGDFFCANLPPIGAAFQGGFFAGVISYTANSVATHALIVAPSATGYNGKSILDWKTTPTFTPGTDSPFDGALNSSNMNNATHPAAQYCEGLTIDGYSDWYLPARYEIDIAYQNLKPTTANNSTTYGINPYSVPERTTNRTAGVPAQTSVAIFKSGGAEAFVAANHWSSTDDTAGLGSAFAWILHFGFGTGSEEYKDDGFLVRAFRRVAL